MKDKEITCGECKKVSVPDRSKWGCETNLCDECLAKGWSEVTLQDMRDDPELFGEVKIKFPYENI